MPESNCKIYCDLKNMQVSMQSYSLITEWLFYRFWKIPRKEIAVESFLVQLQALQFY